MHVHGGVRQFVKRTLSVARARLLYERITLTRFTISYFVCAVLTLFLLGSFQVLGLLHDSEAVSALTAFVEKSNSTAGLAVLSNNTIELCSGLPNEGKASCKPVVAFEVGFGQWGFGDLHFTKFVRDESDDTWDADEVEEFLQANKPPVQSLDPCYASLKWLNDVLHDDQREDVVTFLFQIWLFILSFITIMNESIPHLGAALFGNMLSTGWAGYRVYSTYSLMNLYHTDIRQKACNGKDLLGSWWEERLSDTIPLVVCDGVAFLAMIFLSFKLYKVYDHQTTLRVGASPKVLRIYKLVLVFSVFLQLSGFISLASTGLWIDKVVHGSLAQFASHTKVFLAIFIVILVILLPWLVFGWVCVRKECNVRFVLFFLISFVLLGTSIGMFASDLYRYIFSTWPFFATITVTSFIFLFGTTVLAIICRVNFGQGLAHYIQVNDALEGVDFTPVYFTKPDMQDIEKSEKARPSDTLSPESQSQPQSQSLAPPRFLQPSQPRGDSVYSDVDAGPILISASPPLATELGGVAGVGEAMESPKLEQVGPESPRSPFEGGVRASKNLKRPSQLRVVTQTERSREMPNLSRTESRSAGGSPNGSLSALSYVSDSSPSIVSRESSASPAGRRARTGKPGLPANPRSGISRV